MVDNIFVERLGRTVKYKDISLKEYETVPALNVGLDHSWWFSNHERPHQALRYQTPAQVSLGELVGSPGLKGGEHLSPFA